MYNKSYDAYFEGIYDRFIGVTDTDVVLAKDSIEELESFLYMTAKYFYMAGKSTDV